MRSSRYNQPKLKTESIPLAAHVLHDEGPDPEPNENNDRPEGGKMKGESSAKELHHYNPVGETESESESEVEEVCEV